MSSFPSDSKRSLEQPPGYSSGRQSPTVATKFPYGGLYNDPRTSSTQSLTPSLPEYEEIERRKLLIIYIHGFMGNDTSFQSFPAHVHKYLKFLLSNSHVIHSKIYPRYKTYKSIEIARDNFSKWLQPLESPKTDVILVGHSMGGLLAADVVLMASRPESVLASPTANGPM
jgi:pimeloyl-ACP methyl ester carboxylesterase